MVYAHCTKTSEMAIFVPINQGKGKKQYFLTNFFQLKLYKLTLSENNFICRGGSGLYLRHRYIIYSTTDSEML